MLAIDSHFMFTPEHSANPSTMGNTESLAKNMGCRYQGGPLNPNVKSYNLGGVACLSGHTHKAILIQSKTKVFQEALLAGRVALFSIETGVGQNVFVYGLYGFTGGHTSKKQAAKTVLLIEAIRAEVKAQVQGPVCIVGNVNADIFDIDNLHDLVKNQGWVDLGSKAMIWDQPVDEFICLTSTSRKPSRRDVIIVNPELFHLSLTSKLVMAMFILLILLLGFTFLLDASRMTEQYLTTTCIFISFLTITSTSLMLIE